MQSTFLPLSIFFFLFKLFEKINSHWFMERRTDGMAHISIEHLIHILNMIELKPCISFSSSWFFHWLHWKEWTWKNGFMYYKIYSKNGEQWNIESAVVTTGDKFPKECTITWFISTYLFTSFTNKCRKRCASNIAKRQEKARDNEKETILFY